MLLGFIFMIVIFFILLAVSRVFPDEIDHSDMKTTKAWIWRSSMVFLLLAVMFVGLDSIRIINAGEQGVVTRLGEVTGRTVDPGPALKIPFIETIHIYNTKVQELKFENLESASEELQTINATGVLNYRLNPQAVPWLFQNVGTRGDLETKVLRPSLTDSLKTVMPDNKIEAVLANRGAIADAVVIELQKDFATYVTSDGLPVVFFTAREGGETSIVCTTETVEESEPLFSDEEVDPDATSEPKPTPEEIEVCGPEGEVLHLVNLGFSETFDAAIEERQKQLIQIETARNRLAQVEIEADQVRAKARGEADANTILADSLETRGNFVLQFKAIEELAAGNVKLIILPEDNGIIPILGQDLLGGTEPPPREDEEETVGPVAP